MCVVWSGGSEKQSECQLLNGDPQRSREHTGHNGGADCPVATPSVTFRGQLMVHGISSVQTVKIHVQVMLVSPPQGLSMGKPPWDLSKDQNDFGINTHSIIKCLF